MNDLELVFPTGALQGAAMDFLQEHRAHGERHLHGAGGLDRADSYPDWLQKIRHDLAPAPNQPDKTPRTTYFAVRKADGRIIGMLQIRHRLAGALLTGSGHIGYQVRPTERGKGYATGMMTLALARCRRLGILRVLMICDRGHLASRAVIQKSGGHYFDQIVEDNGNIVERYWIELEPLRSFSQQDFCDGGGTHV